MLKTWCADRGWSGEPRRLCGYGGRERHALGQSRVGNWRGPEGGGRGLTEVSPGVLRSLGLGVEGMEVIYHQPPGLELFIVLPSLAEIKIVPE